MLIIKAMDVAGDRVFAVDSRKAEVYVYDAGTGAFVAKLSPGSEVGKETGWIDIPFKLLNFILFPYQSTRNTIPPFS
jgi:hypothetical protein